MKKPIWTKFLSVILAFITMVPLFPVTAFAADPPPAATETALGYIGLSVTPMIGGYGSNYLNQAQRQRKRACRLFSQTASPFYNGWVD